MGHGGSRVGSGRQEGSKNKEKVLNDEAIDIALKETYNTDDIEKAKVELVKRLLKNDKGVQYIAELKFGKPTQVIEQTNIELEKPPRREFVRASKDDKE